ncbi:unnamed protein product [Dracunculus medinensis]|uniref:SSD domain-containing protein n=1 Tax=Dracunculus medinensis TaxID=318479 RepID=A0A3P7PWC9_DRAME|nr:unnamed protein product [Dracunculus medinensis]
MVLEKLEWSSLCFRFIFTLTNEFIQDTTNNISTMECYLSEVGLINKEYFTRSMYMGAIFGDIRVKQGSRKILTAKYVRMIFDFPPLLDMKENEIFDQQWCESVLNASLPEGVEISIWSAGQYERDLLLTAIHTKRLLPVLVVVLCAFSVISSMRCDFHLSKSILSLLGLLSAGCAIVSSFGLMYLFGFRLIQIALIIPFLVLSIGIDDMFIMISIWQKNLRISEGASIKELMRITFEESSTSICLTTLGNIIIFSFGTISLFPVIRSFCIFCVVSLIFVFIFQMTLFGAFLALDGNREIHRTTFAECYIFYIIGSIIALTMNFEVGLQLSSLVPYDSM